MKKTLVVIENDFSLEHASYVNSFMDQYNGDIIELTGFRQRNDKEIGLAFSNATDLAVQTCFVNGSEQQLFALVGVFAKLKNPINIYIALLGDDLQKFLENNLSPEELFSIKHHNIYVMGRNNYEINEEKHILLDFSHIHKEVYKELSKKHVHNLFIEHYNATATQRPTGKKVKILGCTAYGPQFKNLPIGEIVDELDCSKIDPNPSRGLWIMGNGEPIKLINDSGFKEYEIISQLSSEELLVEISKSTDLTLNKLSRLQIFGLINILEDKELDSMSKANIICEEIKIPKRGNRQIIYNLLNN